MSRRSLLSNFGASTVSRVGSAGMSFLLFWWLARELPPSQVGGFALSMSIFFALQALPLLGLNFALIKATATDGEKLQQTVNDYWWFSVPVTIVLALGLAGYALFANEAPVSTALLITALALVPTSWTVVAEGALVGLEQMHWLARANTLESAWRLVGAGAVVWMGGGLMPIMLVFLVGRVGVAIMYLRIDGLPRPLLRVLPQRESWRAMWRLVPVFFGIVGLAALNTRYDMLSLGRMVSLHDVGEYSAAAKIYEALLMVPTLGAVVVMPRLAQIFQQDEARFATALSGVVRGIAIVATPLALAAALGVPWFMGLAFPADFVDAVPALQLLVFAAVLATVDVVFSSTMLASNSQSADLKCMVLGAVTIVVAVAVLVPRIGITGSALAVLCNLAARVVYRLFWARARFRISGTGFAFARVAACGGLAWLAAGYVQAAPWPVQSLVAVAAYLVLSLVTGLVRPSHLRPGALRHALQRAH